MSTYCNYAKRGNKCVSQTCALTSNAKYIIPLSAVYFKPYTHTMAYPGHDSLYNADTEPEQLKTYESNDSIPSHHHTQDNSHVSPIHQHRKGCSGCKTLN